MAAKKKRPLNKAPKRKNRNNRGNGRKGNDAG